MSSSHTHRLEQLLLHSTTANEPEVRIALLRLSAEIRVRLDKGSSDAQEFFLASVRALSRIKGGAQAELRLACIFYCAHYFVNSGHYKSASECATLLMSLAHRTKSKSWIRKAHSLHAIAYSDMGNAASALIHYTSALTLAREIGDKPGEVAVWLNIGTAMNYAGLFREALYYFRTGIDLSIANGEPSCTVSAYSNMAQSYLMVEEYEQCKRAIDKCLAMSREPTTASEAVAMTIRHFTKFGVSLALGEHREAQKHSQLCSRYALWGSTTKSTVMAMIADGMQSVWSGDAPIGLISLERALALSEGSVPLRADALVALVKACDEVGEAERALGYLRDLMTHIRETRQDSISQLLSLPARDAMELAEASANGSLRALEHRELRLRATVAERELFDSRLEVLERLAITADMKEEESGEHGYRVGKLSALLAAEIGWDRVACSALESAARLHDIGKIGVPDRILLSSKTLKSAEMHFVCAHTSIGAELLGKSNIPQLQLAEDIARTHHEWWNGGGYPNKRAGKRIPLHSRIVALADVFDAITHGRPYEQPWAVDRAIQQIRSLRGKQFDPELTDQFVSLVERLCQEHSNLDAFLGRASRNSPFLQARQKIRQLLDRENGMQDPDESQTRH